MANQSITVAIHISERETPCAWHIASTSLPVILRPWISRRATSDCVPGLGLDQQFARLRVERRERVSSDHQFGQPSMGVLQIDFRGLSVLAVSDLFSKWASESDKDFLADKLLARPAVETSVARQLSAHGSASFQSLRHRSRFDGSAARSEGQYSVSGFVMRSRR